MSDGRTTGAWRTPDVWGIAMSAFFADLGYQAILAVFPLYLVLHLGAPIWLYGRRRRSPTGRAPSSGMPAGSSRNGTDAGWSPSLGTRSSR
ncbi:hypothetical protein B2A_06643 [mine drainage metagenome]|uniref:Uncharacterized protein n=1 Tax=mine drainage metagenome TaxID=410659 RepID=T0ZVA8_9ZZZZ